MGHIVRVTFFDLEDQANPLNGTAIAYRGRLLELLDGLVGRDPFVCELRSESSELVMGIGREGFAQYGDRNGRHSYFVAVAGAKQHLDREHYEEHEFLCGGTPSPIPSRNCLSFDAVREIAVCFLEIGRTHPAFVWEEV